MAIRKVCAGWLGGTIWAIPCLLLVALLVPYSVVRGAALGLLACGLLVQLLPYAMVPEVTRSARLARQRKWAQANFYNILAQHKLRRSPWKGGFRAFRTPFEAPDLTSALRADSGRLLLGLGQYRQAEQVLRALLEELPGHGPSLHNLALALHAQGKLAPARASLRAAVERGYVQPAPEILAKTVLRRLGLPVRLGFLETRVAFYQSLGFHEIALSCTGVSREMDTPWRRGLSLLALGRDEQARQETLEELGRRPDNPFAWLVHGFICARDGQPEQARLAYRKALTLNPPDSPAGKDLVCKEQLFLLTARSGDRKEILDTLAVVEEYESDRQTRALGRALLMAALGRWREVVEQTGAAGAFVRGASLAEAAGYALVELGQIEAGCRLLRRFRAQAITSELPMLDRQKRLSQATETVLRHMRGGRRRGAAQDTRRG